MAETIPTAVATDGNYQVWYVPTIAAQAVPKIATEVNAAGSVDLTLYFTADGWTPGGDQATVTDSRLTATQDYELPGKVTDTLDVVYTFNPLVAANDKARTTLMQGVQGFIVDRPAIPRTTALAAGQFVNVRPISCGVQRQLQPEANNLWKIGQKLFTTGQVQRLVALAA